MMEQLIPQSQLLPADSPAADWCNDADSCNAFWPGTGDFHGVRAAINRRGGIEMDRRSRVADAISGQYERLAMAAPHALEEFRSGAEVISVGHQLQAGGGPAYFHYKILSALRWSRKLRASGTPSIVVFWMASEDHDFEEISETNGARGDSFRWNPSTYKPTTPVGMIPWDVKAEASWNAWCQRQGVSPGVSPVKAVTLADRMRGWLLDWFPDDDVLLIDGNDVQLKEMVQFLWKSEWNGQGIKGSLKESNAAFSSRWGEAPLQPRDNNLFVLDANGLRTRADRWSTDQQKQGKGDEAWKTLRPEQNSPNAALRPLYQEWLLQSAAFVGGPSEVAYWLSLGKSFVHHRISQPALLLRDGALVIDERASHAVEWIQWNPLKGWWTGEVARTYWVDLELNRLGEVAGPFDAWSKALVAYAEGIPGDAVPTTRAALSRMEQELQQVRKKWRKIWRQQHSDQCALVEEVFDTWLTIKGKPQERGLSALVAVEAMGGWELFKAQWFELLENTDEPQFLVFSSHH